MNRQDVAHQLSALEARIVVLERQSSEQRERTHDLADLLNEVGLKVQVLWAQWQAKRERS